MTGNRAPRGARLLALSSLVAGLLVLTGCAPTEPAPPTTDAAEVTPGTLRLISWSSPRAEQANIFAAEELGYFDDEKIDFSYIPGQGSGDALRQLLAGNGDMAFAGPEAVFLAQAEGAELVSVYNIYPQNAFVLVVRADSGIDSPEDLAGKRIGVLSLASGGRYNTTTLLEANGLSESDVELVAVGVSPAPFLEGQVDAMMTTVTGVPLLADAGELVTFPVADYVNLPTDVLVVTRAAYDDPAKRDIILRSLRAILRGTEYMIDDPEGAAEIGAANGLDITDPAIALAVIRAYIEISQSAGTEQNGLGWFDLDLIQEGADFYTGAGIIPEIDISESFTNDLVLELQR